MRPVRCSPSSTASPAPTTFRAPAVRRSFDDRPQQQAKAGDRQNRPQGSGRPAAGFFESGTSSSAPANAAATIGTLTRNMEPHQNRASSRRSGRSRRRARWSRPRRRWRGRSAGSRNRSLTIDSDAGIVIAAPAPITARHAISRSTEPENAAPTDPAAKTPRPMRKNRLRPEPVGHAAADEQQAREDHRVGVDDPLQLTRGGGQLPDEDGRGHVKDGVVHIDDQGGGT
jgi:hypothetical protein